MNESVRSRGMTIVLSCLLHLGLVMVLVLGQQWVQIASAVRPPVLPVHLVTLATAVEPQPEPPAPPAALPRQRVRPPRLIAPPRPQEATAAAGAPAPVRVEQPAPPAPLPTVPTPAADPTPVASAPTPPSEEAPGPAATTIVPASAPGGPAVSVAPPITAAARPSTAIPDGVTRYARPRGGYQVRPTYPAAPRRLGIQGTTLLRVHVLVDGRIGDVLVEESAGHPDLDQAARDAVRAWRFDPARRGNDPVAMWVLLPVEFRLK